MEGLSKVMYRARTIQCPLCGETVKSLHEKSHLIPEWMYKDCYYGTQKLLYINLKSGDVRERQGGFYDKIICGKCESESQIYDHYASLILISRQKNSSSYKAIDRKSKKITLKGEVFNYSHWKNIKFHKFQRFIFASVLRTHLAGKKRKMSLFAERHFEKMREIYKNESIVDDKTYPIIVYKLPEDDRYRNRVDLPFTRKVNSHNVIEFYGAGYIFWVFVSRHKKPDFVQSLCLNREGSLYLIHEYFENTGTFKALRMSNFAKYFKSYQKKKAP